VQNIVAIAIDLKAKRIFWLSKVRPQTILILI
jgi:hypothetical protein